MDLVPASEKSPHFDAVNGHLELGGTLYGYADVDGDAAGMAKSIHEVLTQLAAVQPAFRQAANTDVGALLDSLGITDVQAVGVSSVREKDGLYRNRAFLYTPGGRRGFLSIFGGTPGPFINARMAPEDADAYVESDFDARAAYDTAERIVGIVAGAQAADDMRMKSVTAGESMHLSLYNILQSMQGRITFIMRMDPEKTFSLPPPTSLSFPQFSLLLKVDGVGPAIEPYFTSAPGFERSVSGQLRVYTKSDWVAIGGSKFVFAFEGSALYVASSAAFAAECVARTQGLDKNPAFAAALAAAGPEGNGVSWTTPRFLARLRDVAALNAKAPPAMKTVLDRFTEKMPTLPKPVLALRVNLTDGILVKSELDHSLKTELAVATIYNPITIGLIAAMAVPAFEKVRLQSQQVAVQNNLHRLYDAANRFCSEHGLSECDYGDIVGPGKLIESITPAVGEHYEGLTFYRGRPIRFVLPSGHTLRYPSSGLSAPHNQIRRPDGTEFPRSDGGADSEPAAPTG